MSRWCNIERTGIFKFKLEIYIFALEDKAKTPKAKNVFVANI